jgi:hypothetical protein
MLDLNTTAAVLTSIGVVVGLIGAFVAWVRKLAKIDEKVSTSNGKSIGAYSEETSVGVTEINRKLDMVIESLYDNKVLAQEALMLAKGAHDRIDILKELLISKNEQ